MAEKHDPFMIAENTFHGAGKTLEAALEDAWNQAKGSGPGTFRIGDIYFKAENPITEYSVVITRNG